MTMKICVRCGRLRSEKYMQEAVFRDAYWSARDVGVDIWRCGSFATCKKARKESSR